MTGRGAKLKVHLSECYLATVLLWPIRAAGAWLERGLDEGAGLKHVIALSCVELRVIGVRHDAAVLTVIHLGCWTGGERQTGGDGQYILIRRVQDQAVLHKS